MEPTVPHKILEPGVFQGKPEDPETTKASSIRLIRTMKLDMAEAIKNQKETSVSIAIAEQKKVATAEAAPEPKAPTESAAVPAAPKPIGRVVVVIVILLLVGLLGLAYVFVLPKLRTVKLPVISMPSFGTPSIPAPIATTTEAISLAPSLIPADTEKRFNIAAQTKDQVFSDIEAESKSTLSSGSIENLYFTDGTATISANRLFIFAGISAPEILVRSLERPFMVGFWGGENGEAVPFIILQVSGSDTGLAGMLEWEALLPRSVDTVFNAGVEERAATATKFHDILVRGKDARVLSTASGADIAYTFADSNTIVIAGNKTALEALIPLVSKN